ncbi:hypothetical protein P168DRAFT_321617 [Aspergillus campestris IBT 28561]|uniref:Uncharacterized protein n=1 Tax=Aspergillus campestris (strain IBT 28561) TaxID=1392248 RepID=A0A2I1CU93_ASPC2|nr:uncharacterized protein P168DRAFT_321617 [Aspergillus campestris IBT 28561]PKY01202.1 hypothetical protein P168DRAFT_321617 [Aspergillus campestris IBT 28561]
MSTLLSNAAGHLVSRLALEIDPLAGTRARRSKYSDEAYESSHPSDKAVRHGPFLRPLRECRAEQWQGERRGMNVASTPQAPEPIKDLLSDMDDWDNHKGNVDLVRIELGRPTRIGANLAIPEFESPHWETHQVDQMDRQKHTGGPPGPVKHIRGIPDNIRPANEDLLSWVAPVSLDQ